MKQFQFEIPIETYWETKEFESIALATDYARTLCQKYGTDWVRVYYGEDFEEYVDVTKDENPYKTVKARTYEVAEEMKKRIEPLIEKAFNTGAFDVDEAYKDGYVTPKAIVAAVLKTIAEETTGSLYEIQAEADDIYLFL